MSPYISLLTLFSKIQAYMPGFMETVIKSSTPITLISNGFL